MKKENNMHAKILEKRIINNRTVTITKCNKYYIVLVDGESAGVYTRYERSNGFDLFYGLSGLMETLPYK